MSKPSKEDRKEKIAGTPSSTVLVPQGFAVAKA
jgi:hypothetical protein